MKNYCGFFFCEILIFTLMILLNEVRPITWLGLYKYARLKEQERVPFSKEECWHSHMRFGLDRRHLRFCQQPQTSNVMHAIVKSAQAVAYYCPQTFQDRRWNCSSVEYLPTVLPDLAKGTREQAVVYAMSSGAMLFEIARRCSMDKIANCPCGRHDWAIDLDPNMPQDESNASLKPFDWNEEYIWNGCADNVEIAHTYTRMFLAYDRMKDGTLTRRRRRQMNRRASLMNNFYQNQFYARQMLHRRARQIARANPSFRFPQMDSSRFARQTPVKYSNENVTNEIPTTSYSVDEDREDFVLSPEQKLAKTLRLLNGHNYEAGLKIMEKNRKYTCKCHGISGSCTQKVCFRQLQRLDSPDIQNAFRQHYLQSKNVEMNANDNGLIAKEYRYGLYVNVPVEETSLVYTEHSPDYCELDLDKGSFGTHGRKCHAEVQNGGPAVWGDCQHMCCRRGHFGETMTLRQPCHCRISSNFKVECDECSSLVTNFYCN